MACILAERLGRYTEIYGSWSSASEAELAAHQLVVPFAPRVGLREGYWLVWRRGTESARPLAAFRRWLVAEFAKPARDG